MLRSMFMRRACVVSLLLVSCFDGGNASGLPCNSNAECGNEMCIDGFCGGPQTTGGTTPSTSETESMTTLATNTDPTTTETDPSSTEPSTTMTTMAVTTADTTDSDDPTTGNPNTCPVLPLPTAMCDGGDIIPKPTISAIAIPDESLGAIFSVVAGDFVGDEQLDIAVRAADNATRIIENEKGDIWQVTTIDFRPSEIDLVDPYDFAAGDFNCDDGTVFLYAGQEDRFAYVGYTKDDGFYETDVRLVPVPTGSFSLAVGDLVPDDAGFIDVVLAGNSHVTVLQNSNGFDESMLDSFTVVNFDYAEPWDTLVIGEGQDLRMLVPAGDETDQDPTTRDQAIYSFRVDTERGGTFAVEPAMPPQLDVQFANPWAMVSGDFDGDGAPEVAVAERNINQGVEGTDQPGLLRFFEFDDTDGLEETVAARTTVGIGVNSLAAADMNCDGNVDIVVGTTGEPGIGGTAQVVMGAQNLDELEVLDAAGVSGISASSRIAIADFDGDGRPEAAIGDYGLSPVEGDRVVLVDAN
jgi:hypothetical protein